MTTCTGYCKFCGKKYKEKSKWLPGDILDLIIDIKHFFHAVRHHYKECGFKCVGIGLLILVKVVLYPIYLLLSLLYEI